MVIEKIAPIKHGAFEDTKTETIFKDLAMHRVHTSEEISKELGLSTDDVIKSLHTLIDAGLVSPVSTSGDIVFYSPSIKALKLIRAGGINIDYY